MSLPHPIHFFQIIGENSLQNGELRIPRSFVSKHWGEGISNPIFLVLPNYDAKWEMKWEKRGLDVWLVNDWRKFAEFYSLYKDQFLMFKYEGEEGKSQFEVRICHRSALEIEYPTSNGDSNGEDSDNSIEILDGISSSHHRKRPKSPLPYFHSSKKKKVNPTEDPNSQPSQHVETKCAQSSGTKLDKKKFCAGSANAKRPKNKGGRGMFSKCEAINNEEASEDTESRSAMQRAKAFTSDNPWFIREMRPSHIHNKPFLTIPGKYITEQEQKESSSVTLWVSDGRTWSSKFSRNSCNGQIGITIAWKSFVEDNHVKLGDVCVFEKTECRGNSFRVVIFPATEESTPPLPQGYGDGGRPRKQSVRNNLAECSKSDVFNDSKSYRYNCTLAEDHFTLTLKPSQLKSAMHLPRFFVRNYVHSDQHVTLRAGERSWKVRLDYYPKHGNARLSEGWPIFVKECDLKAGDDCIFQLIDRENLVLQVRVSRCIH